MSGNDPTYVDPAASVAFESTDAKESKPLLEIPIENGPVVSTVAQRQRAEQLISDMMPAEVMFRTDYSDAATAEQIADQIAEDEKNKAEKIQINNAVDAFNAEAANPTVIALKPGEKPAKPQTGQPLDGIEILLKLVETGEIDPKNVDIIDVTDKFLKAIAAAPKENLRQSGRILFHASVLLRMKAEALLAAATAELDTGGDDFIDFDEEAMSFDSDQLPRQITLKDLEKALVRRPNNKQNRQRKVTLQQLIDALKDAEKLEKERLEKKPRHRIEMNGYIDVNDVEDILELAHDEDIEDTIAKVDQLLEEALKVGDCLSLIRLIKMLGPTSDWVDAFLAMLFLSNAGKIVLEQEEFYGDVFLVRTEAPPADQAFKITGTGVTSES